MREKMMRFMQGRYGVDQFNNFLMKLFFGEFIFYFLFRRLVPEVASIMYYLSLATLVYTYYRMFSRNIYKRVGNNNEQHRKTVAGRVS